MAGRYRSVLRARESERLFPIRIRIRVPPDGLRRADTELTEWLNERAGGRYGKSSGGLGLDHFMFLHLPTAEIAQAFLEAWKDRLDIDLKDHERIIMR